MTEDQIKHMAERFLGWPLPENFNPDGGISFKRTHGEGTPYPGKHEPTGTNLFGYTDAVAMVRHMLDGLPKSCGAAVPALEAEATLPLGISTALYDFEESLRKAVDTTMADVVARITALETELASLSAAAIDAGLRTAAE